MAVDDWVQVIERLGISTAIAFFLIWRLNGKLSSLADAVTKAKEAIIISVDTLKELSIREAVDIKTFIDKVQRQIEVTQIQRQHEHSNLAKEIRQDIARIMWNEYRAEAAKQHSLSDEDGC